MITLPSYEISAALYEDASVVVYRGRRLQDQQAVILKTLRGDHPSLAHIARFKREYEISKTLDIAGVEKVYTLEQEGDHPVLVFADSDGVPLNQLLTTGPFTPLPFLRIAIQLADTLGQIHQRNIIHKDLKPANILYHVSTEQVTIADFSIASRLSQQNQSISNPTMIEGTLAYMSPEQTGRMNRVIDYRSDFYSLGVTFYELLTGQLPFQSADPMDMVHAHLARQPRPPHEIDPTLAPALSAIIMKLLAKNAEDRYQSASGLKADLTICLTQWQNHSKLTHFIPGAFDHSERFQIPQKLYGREGELAHLLAAFDRISTAFSGQEPANRPVELVLVSGYSGSGKSALVNEIHKPIARQRGYFVSGKFDQFQRNLPYRAIIQAFQELVRQILTESEERIMLWQARLTQALGSVGQVIVEVIPEVELLIGRQPAIPSLPPTEAQNRFNLVFERLIEVFSQPEHPLVIFLDDLQWADSATLRLLQTLLTSPAIDHLLLIGAYRDNEVSPSHPLLLTLGEVEKVEIAKRASISQFILGSLDRADLNQLIADTLKCGATTALPLTDLVLQKTAGNPFFVRQFLLSLYQENLLSFNPNSGAWGFDLARIESVGMTDNVVTLMANKIQKLAEPTQQVLKLAACIGNRFDLDTLATVNQKSPSVTAGTLWAALQERLILPVSGSYELLQMSETEATPALEAEHRVVYRFLHDRVQQAAYALLPDQQRKAVHLQVGQLMLAKSSETEREEKLFDIVNQCNLGQDLLINPAERTKLAQLNLTAAKKAKVSAAYKAALGYCEMGQALLHEDNWSQDYPFRFALTLELAECAFLAGQFEQAEAHFHLLLQQAQSRLDQARVYALQVHQYETLTRYADAITAGHAALALFAVTFPALEEDRQRTLDAELSTIQQLVGDRPIDTLLDLPILTEPAGKMVMTLLSNLHTACYLVGDKTLTLLNTAYMVRISLTQGHTPESAHGYALHAMNIGPIGGQYKEAFEFGILALRLNERLPNPGLRAKILMNFSWAISPWRRPWSETFLYTKEAFHLGNENGCFSDAGFAIWNDSYHSLLVGRELEAVQQACALASDYLKRIKMDGFVDAPQAIRQWARSLQGQTVAPTSLTDRILADGAPQADHYDEQHFEQIAHRQHPLFLMFHFIAKLAILYTFEDYKAACLVARKAKRVIRDFTGTIWDALRVYYHALALAGRYPTLGVPQQVETRRTIQALCVRMKIWAENCPENFQYQYLLMTAELARIDGNVTAAIPAYEQAIEAARQQGLVYAEALGNELYARFWLVRHNEKVARLYLREAVAAYSRWGATAKVKELTKKYPNFLAATASHSDGQPTTNKTTNATAAIALDLAAALKAAQTISSEIALDALLENLLRIVMLTAGAQRGFLILPNEQQWFIEAAGTVDPAAITVLQALPVEASQALSIAIVNYVKRTGEDLVIADAGEDSRWANDPYVLQARPKSILCTAILRNGEPVALLYLENNLATHAFTPDRIEMIRLLSAQAAISLENARLYEGMKLEVSERRRAETALRQREGQLRLVNEQLEDYSQNLAQKVSDRTREIEQRRRVAESLRDMLTILNSNRPLAEVLEHIVSEASRLLGSDTSIIYQLEDGRRMNFRIQTAYGLQISHLADRDFPTELGPTIVSGRYVIVADTAEELGGLAPQPSGAPPRLSHLARHCRALLALPLVVSAEIYGCLLLCYNQPRRFSEEEIHLAIAFGDQARLAIENARLRQRVEQAAVAEERGRLARELHDSVTQSLYSLTLLTEGWKRMARAGQAVSLEETLSESGSLAQQALKEMRLLVHELRPPALEKEGLLGALHQRLSAVEKRAGVEVRLRNDPLPELPLFVQDGLYWIAQEALNNAIKHAAATSVQVNVRYADEMLELEVADNGSGFDPDQAAGGGGVGLSSMSERAERFGGRLSISSAIGQGTRVRVMVVIKN